MNNVIAHRGPDDEGVKILGHVGLGHRRLSIIDIDGGVQPMTDSKHASWIVFNGEIYNYRELRNELEIIGIDFRTKSDTETLINFISTCGKSSLDKLNGMFSFAYYRPEDDYLLLARDHLGIKPLYVWEGTEWIVFASEIKAFFALPWIKFEMDESLLEELLTFRFVTGRNTLFRGIYQLEPGEFMEVKEGKLRGRKFWDLDQNKTFTESSHDEIINTFNDYLSSSIEGQLVSDVPVGTFLSGGVDSSIVTAIASIKKPDQRLKSFVVGFDSPEWDERAYALRTSKKYNTDHHEFVMSSDTLIKDIKKLSYYNDEPISHPNTIPFYHLSELAREKVKVILTGEGADEMLSGYPRHQIIRIREKAKVFPDLLLKMLGSVLSGMPHRKLKMVGGGLLFNNDEDALIYNSQFVPARVVNSILAKDIPREGLTYRRRYANYFKKSSLHHRLMALEVKTYLLSALHRLDRMSMAHGLECRVPFLDYRLVEWVMRLKPGVKVQGAKGKLILKQLAEKYIDKEVIYRPKSGFGLPLADWFRDKSALKPFLDEMTIGNYHLSNYFEQKVINTIIKEHVEYNMDHSEILWILFCLHTWYDVYQNI